ncbi:ring-cleaving dioxygenase [Pseudalkalibacillus hwajinpoensis]|uniref:ring-cleaving dioxygenase n=1 Tax=Guptibacillus hwajinpoensis TaxID=208199 RepID=UPI001CD2DC2D|nr:ring-cleaving dioxygenase [Pseudalkalibacillus hwajinpoensis]MCA0990466.1 ring-cleaving dioxygenase [Pseudalkalibacillus hwajinpoensis]
MKHTTGIHHITAIVGNPQENVDFYSGVLGLRLVKKTVNFDDPGTYHLYFGNEEGAPGTIMTFFPWSNAHDGEIGSGQVGVTSFVVPTGSLPFWKKRLDKLNVENGEMTRFGEKVLAFDDPHGLHLELVEREEGEPNTWSFGGVSTKHAIKGFAGATLLTGKPNSTMTVLEEVLGFIRVAEEEDFVRFKSSASIGNTIDVKKTPMVSGRMGSGTVHHIAFRANDFNDHEEWRNLLDEKEYGPTPVVDRQYFNAIYFREEGGILFEIATDPPGFAKDEDPDEMGKKLLLPPWLEEKRPEIERVLEPANARVLEGDK